MELFTNKQILKVYYILIESPNGVKNEVNTQKQNFKNWIGYGNKLNSPPHISLVQFKLDIQREEILLTELNGIVLKQPKFAAKTLGIEGFENNRLISISIAPEPLKSLHALIISTLRMVVRVAHLKVKKLSYPHITIGHVPVEKDFNSNYARFKSIEFMREFEINKITLLVESESPNRKWDKVKDFYLQ
ncbi:2'-5' RNA ligase family protein [Owenweeksia hongkongensis]|uniref:2'-5' RNA ligase family protein n=1 Tax=Owenweeksia hongkongensis TaxID=253245 RepID=UPI003A90B406